MDVNQIGRYQIIEKLGEGGMGVVYKALDPSLDRYVAIKVLTPETVANPELMARFQIEAKAQARLSHTNIATLHSFEQAGNTWLIVMEYLDGESFEQMVRRRGPIPSAEAVPLFRQALLGIGFAHRMGVIHRDIKPSNIMVTNAGIVKVMDFGIAKVLGGQRMTRTGTRMGTVAYMSPEQIRNMPVDIRSDIYSLGVTLFELLTAHLPFEGESDFQMMSDHVNTPPPLPTRHYPYIPAGVERATIEALAKDPDQRFQTCEAFGAALEHPGEVAAVSATSRPTTPPPIAPTPTPPPLAPTYTVPPVAPTYGASPTISTPYPTIPPQQAWPTPTPPAPPTWPPQPPMQQQGPTPPPIYAQPEKKRRSPWLYIVLGVVGGAIGIFAILVAIGLYERGHSNGGGTSSSGSDTGGGSVYSNTSVNNTATGTTNSTNSTNSTITPASIGAPVYVQKDVLTGNAGEVWDTALSPDSSTLVAGDNDKTVKLWDLSNDNVRTLTHQSGPIFGVAFTPDGQQIASASADKSVITWATSSGDAQMSFPGDFPLWTVAYSPDGSVIAAAGHGTTIDMWSLPSGKYLGAITAPAPDISEIRFSPDGKLLAGGVKDGSVYLWNVSDQSQYAEYKSHASAVHSVAFSPDGSHLASADANGVIYLWNVASGSSAPLKMLAATDQQSVNDLVFTPDGNYLLSASDDKNIALWNTSNGELANTFTGHTDAVVSLAISHDGKLLVSSSKDGTIRLWQISGGQ
jgi:serine/threonine protein kinase